MSALRFYDAKLQKNIEVDKILCLTAYDKIWPLAQKYEAIRREKPPRVWQLSVACKLVFGGGEVEEGFVVTSFMLPVAYQVFDAVLLLRNPGEEILFMIDKQLAVFLGSVERTLPAVQPFYFSQSAVLIQEIEESVAETSGSEK